MIQLNLPGTGSAPAFLLPATWLAITDGSKPMIPSRLVTALRDGQLRIQSESLTADEKRVLCEQFAALMGRETVACNDQDQQRWLLAKAWASAAGKTKPHFRHSGPRMTTGIEQVRAILAKLPLGD